MAANSAVQAELQSRLERSELRADSLRLDLRYAQGGNEQLVKVQQQWQDRLLALDDELEGLRGNLSNTQSELEGRVAALEMERSGLQTALGELRNRYATVVKAYQAKLDSVAKSLEQDSLLVSLAEIRSRNGSFSVVVQEDRLFRRNVSNRLLLTASRPILEPLARLLENEPLLDLIIIGHTDNQPTGQRDLSNWDFSALRAAVLADELTKNYGVSPNRLTAAGQGDSSPAQSNASPEGRQANRRLEFRFTNSLVTLLRELEKVGSIAPK